MKRHSKCMTAGLLMLAIMVGAPLAAQAKMSELVVKAAGFANDRGVALFAVVDSPEAYDDINEKALAKSRQKIAAGKAQTSFTLPYGWYAV
jgi:uncharacterized protein (DUF2141 family)